MKGGTSAVKGNQRDEGRGKTPGVGGGVRGTSQFLSDLFSREDTVGLSQNGLYEDSFDSEFVSKTVL